MNKLFVTVALALTVLASTGSADAAQKKHTHRHLQCTTQYVLGGTVTTCK